MVTEQNRLELKNYPDPLCYWGYMTLCQNCLGKAPKYIDRNPIKVPLPSDRCEICKKKGVVVW